MNFEEAFKVADIAVFDRTGRHLTDAEATVLQGSWQDQSYDELAAASNYSASYLKQDLGPKLWKLLSEALGEEVSKKNFRAALERRYALTHSLPVAQPLPATPISTETNFVGREQNILDLDELVSQGNRVILIQGQGGVGKTTLARRYIRNQGYELRLELWMPTESSNLTPVASVVEEWLRRDFNEDPGREFGVNLERLRRKLQVHQVGILIDNLESSLNRHGRFLEAHRPYLELLRVLADPGVQSVTLITSRERLCESGVTVQSYLLEGLDEAAWHKFFHHRGVNVQPAILSAMGRAYAGNAKAMQILSGVIQTDFEGDMAAYWQENSGDLLIERELENLVASQFDRLQHLDPEAYQLLYRLGCYRYQDVSSVSIDGLLHLLWDVPEPQRRRIIRSLQDRSLVEARKGKYWLHPVIRAEARGRLRQSSEWETVNRQAAQFWTDSVLTVESIDDAMQAFEAYYHYLELEDFKQASEVILQTRETKLSGSDRLGRSFYKLGLLQQMITAINFLIPQLDSSYHLSGLYSVLGVLYRLSGDIHRAIACHEESGRIATQALAALPATTTGPHPYFHNFQNWQAGALLNIGLCKIDLGELEEANQVFDSLNTLTQQTGYSRPSTGFYFAFLKSCQGETSSVVEFAERKYQEIQGLETARWVTEYRLVVLGLICRNLGETQKALELYQRALLCADQTHHTQVKAKALEGIAELYREQREYEQAIANHQAAIQLLEQLGAKCDLAEAYYQLGLTYQYWSKLDQSQTYFQQASQLFEQIPAPRQVEKVRRYLPEYPAETA